MATSLVRLYYVTKLSLLNWLNNGSLCCIGKVGRHRYHETGISADSDTPNALIQLTNFG